MAKENSLVVKISEFIAKYFLYAAVFLTPIIFAPWTAEALDFNKQAVLVVLIFVALFAWMLKALVLGKFQLNKSKINIAVGILFLVYLFSTIFSVSRYGSFWGWPQSTADSLLSVILVLLAYFLATNVLKRENIYSLAATLSASIVIAQIIGILQIFGIFFHFNTIGSPGSLGFLCAVALPLATAMLIASKKWWKILFGVQILLSAVIFFLLNYSFIWWIVILGSVLMVVFGVFKRDFFDGRWMALPMFFMTVALFFLILSPQIPWLSQRTSEINLSQSATFKIALQTVRESPLFGSGPGTFFYGFSKFKDPDFAKTPLWNVAFSQGASKVLTDLATVGFLGLDVLVAIFAMVLYFGSKHLILQKISRAMPAVEKEEAKFYWILALGIFVALAVESLGFILYNSNLSLNFVFFFAIACLVLLALPDKKDFELKSSSLPTLVITFSFTLAFIFGMGLLLLDSQRYFADVKYARAMSLYQAKNTKDGLKNLEGAASMNGASDLYFRQLSQAYLVELKNLAQEAKNGMSEDQKKSFQQMIGNAVNSAKIATDLNPKNAVNWANRANVYQNLSGLIADSNKWAMDAYNQAINLDPNDPYLFAQEGLLDFVSSQNLPADQAEQKTKLLSSAKDVLEKAVHLNPNYSNGLYSLGLVYDALGQKEKALETFSIVQQLNPSDTAVPKIISNIKAGLPALQQPASSPTPTPKPKQ